MIPGNCFSGTDYGHDFIGKTDDLIKFCKSYQLFINSI